MTIEERMQDMLDACNKYNYNSIPVMKNELEEIAKELRLKRHYEEKLIPMLKEDNISLRDFLETLKARKEEEIEMINKELKKYE